MKKKKKRLTLLGPWTARIGPIGGLVPWHLKLQLKPKNFKPGYDEPYSHYATEWTMWPILFYFSHFSFDLKLWEESFHIHLVTSYDSQTTFSKPKRAMQPSRSLSLYHISCFYPLHIILPIKRGKMRVTETERERERESERDVKRKYFVSYKTLFPFHFNQKQHWDISFVFHIHRWSPLSIVVAFVGASSTSWMGCWIMGRLSTAKGVKGNMSAKTAQQYSSTRWTRININVRQLVWEGYVIVVRVCLRLIVYCGGI